MKFNKEPKYILHLVLIMITIFGVFYLTKVYDKPFWYMFIVGLVTLYLSDNIYEEWLGV